MPLRPLPVLSVTDAAEMLPATMEECREAVLVVHGVLGLGPSDPENERVVDAFFARVDEVALVLASSSPSWSVAALREAGRALSRSALLDDKIRFGRPVTPADFERQRAGEERTTKDHETGEERVITTLRGFPLKVRASALYTASEARALWDSTGGQGGPHPQMTDRITPDGQIEDRPKAMFTAVHVADVGRRFRLKA